MTERPKERASQRIVDQLRLSIREGDLTPGDRLPAERDLCERYGVSRVTIREALRSLEASGLVDIRLGSHGGAFVTAPTAADAAAVLEDYLTLSAITPAEIREIRAILELAIVPLACERAGADDVERLTSAYDDLARASEEGRYDPQAVRSFHAHLAHASKNNPAEVVLSSLYAPMVHTSGQGAAADARQPTVDEHRQLLEAVRDRDADRATEILRELP